MYIEKLIKIVKDRVDNYPFFDVMVRELAQEKDSGTQRDVNSFIKSKNTISKIVEIMAVKNIMVDEKIYIIEKWRTIIEETLNKFKKVDKFKGSIIEYKIATHKSNKEIGELKNLGENCVRLYIRDFYIELGIGAILKKMIDIQMLNR